MQECINVKYETACKYDRRRRQFYQVMQLARRRSRTGCLFSRNAGIMKRYEIHGNDSPKEDEGAIDSEQIASSEQQKMWSE